ncbi:MAG: sigma 54-interacting transcriptional regulator, partial [Nitrospirales bacterium]|nr:sigma 54-interacting transcriptional regulator [Nitrospirales bacterium]
PRAGHDELGEPHGIQRGLHLPRPELLRRPGHHLLQDRRALLGFEGELPDNLLACDVLVQSNICSSQECALERALCGERVSNFEAMIRRRDGGLIPVSINTDFLCNEEGRLIGLIEVIRDISISQELTAKVTEVNELKHRLGEQMKFENMVGRSQRMQDIFSRLPAIASSKTSVLITGESGTGKELIAYALHANSPRRQEPFVVVNCSSLSEGVLESEIFGHVKGAFTGAHVDKPGRFELADKGTVFLDEIGEMSLPTQVKLLRVLEHGEFERVGANQTIKVDVRIVAATNRNLIQAVKEGTFREDLFYRIRVIPIELPPLRERMEDLPLLINHFIEKFNRVMAKEVRQVTSDCLAALERYGFPGNIRELQNIIEHAFVCCESHVIQFDHLPPDIQRHGGSASMSNSLESLEEIEGEAIQQVLQKTGWRFNEASKRLGVSRSTLWRKIKLLGISSNGRKNNISRKR